MSTGVPLPSRAVLVAVACLSAAAALSLINVAASLFGITRALIQSPPGFSSSTGFLPESGFLTLTITAALAGALGLAVIRRWPGAGWTWLLVAGTVLTAALVLPELASTTSRVIFTNTALLAAIGAGPVLALMGLLGAANWLTHGRATGMGAAVAGVTLVAPIAGGIVLVSLALNESLLDVVRVLNTSLSIVSIAGAAGVAVLVWQRPWTPPAPTLKVTVIGAVAALLPAAPAIAVRVGWQHTPLDGADPLHPFLDSADRWVLLVGLSGLAVFGVAVGLAFGLGPKALGAALATGLVLYGTSQPTVNAMATMHNSAGALAAGALGLALGIAAAMSRWRAWLAGAACAVAGISTLLTMTDAVPSGLAAAWVLLIGVIAAVTAYGASAELVAEPAQAPVALGAIAIAIQVGLTFSGTLLQHSELGTMPRNTLIVAAGVALLLGALLVLAARLSRESDRPDQAMLSPGLAR